MGEKELFSAGREVNTYQLGNYHVGMSICYDLRFPGLYQKHADQGVEVGLICAEWPITRVDHWRSLSKARAIEHQQFVVAVNRVGKDPDYTYGGHSIVYSPTGKQLAGLDHADEGVIEAELDLSLVRDFRNLFDVREDRWL
jgi:predicted amidohydrolase